jgi:bifunctional DNA-binding transcriptional regulator/antitoxin component of YhaV-PrlF toxin-antitoxin module
MNRVYGTAVIRERGQLTIPEKIREVRSWASPVSVVTITSTKPNEIVIQPYSPQKAVDWNRIWENIAKSRSFKGKKVKLSEFIIKDRSRH